MRKINPISFLWDDAYSRLCSLAMDWCADGMPVSALEELYQFAESETVTRLQLESDEYREAFFHQQFEETFHALVSKHAREYEQAKERITQEQMDKFLSGRPLRDRFAKVEQEIRTQRAKIDVRMGQLEARIKSSSSREEKEQLTHEFLYLAHQSGIWSRELLRRIEERL